MERQKAILIRGPLDDLGDLLSISRTEGKRVLGVDKVRVSPNVIIFNGDSYIVVVSPKGDGCSKNANVGVGKSLKE